ncbi:hypothetical protein CATMQ487_44350 [Sphaerotilus microaerophilus]|uniref:Exonuclease domain-containing protein n=2 Tax=Sphaerotilus microaerophilus TaxID=2914710 RepID=A0ABM7YS98_9BURK|nr:hypothetical protein CATMQ487_44350 [Sphaerotilus sp. FB-5]
MPNCQVSLALIDTETTGLDPAEDELIGMSILLGRVDLHSGGLFQVLDRYTGWRQPGRFSRRAQRITGMNRAKLRGHSIDWSRVQRLIAQADLLVGHAMDVDRSFLLPWLPQLAHKPVACSLRDIDWFGMQGMERADIDYLAEVLGVSVEASTEGVPPERDCDTLSRILAQPLPAEPDRTGFQALISAACRRTQG